jgi:hypothetical protein
LFIHRREWGFCIETFISSWFLWAGNNRTFNRYGGGYKTHQQFIATRNGHIRDHIGLLGESWGVTGVSPNFSISVQPDPDEQGAYIITATGYGRSALFSSPAGPGIDYEVRIRIGPDGIPKVVYFRYDGFPAIEIWAYDANGNAYLIWSIMDAWWEFGDLVGGPDWTIVDDLRKKQDRRF